MADAPDYIAKDTYTGRHVTTLRPGFRCTTWRAGELAQGMNPEGVIFEWFGRQNGKDQFSRTRYVSDSDGNLHCYDSDGAKKIIHPAQRKLRILTQ